MHHVPVPLGIVDSVCLGDAWYGTCVDAVDMELNPCQDTQPVVRDLDPVTGDHSDRGLQRLVFIRRWSYPPANPGPPVGGFGDRTRGRFGELVR